MVTLPPDDKVRFVRVMIRPETLRAPPVVWVKPVAAAPDDVVGAGHPVGTVTETAPVLRPLEPAVYTKAIVLPVELAVTLVVVVVRAPGGTTV
jgi:hypothetical protein